MAVVFDHPKSLLDVSTHFCPGCGHGIVHRLVCEVIDEMGIEGDTIGVVPVGCSVMSYTGKPHAQAPCGLHIFSRLKPPRLSVLQSTPLRLFHTADSYTPALRHVDFGYTSAFPDGSGSSQLKNLPPLQSPAYCGSYGLTNNPQHFHTAH